MGVTGFPGRNVHDFCNSHIGVVINASTNASKEDTSEYAFFDNIDS